MTIAVSGKPRANSRGHYCPPWCVADHGKVLIEASADHPAIYSDAHTGRQRSDVPLTSARALMKADDEIIVYAQANGGAAEAYIGYRSMDAVEDLAKFVDALARLTHDEHHELADAIRQAGQDAES